MKLSMNYLSRCIDKLAWDFERFGLTPSKLLARVNNSNSPKIFITSIPKCGTHLLERAVCLLPRYFRKSLPTININSTEQVFHYISLRQRIVASIANIIFWNRNKINIQAPLSGYRFLMDRIISGCTNAPLGRIDMNKALCSLRPGEVLVSHSYYNPHLAEMLNKQNIKVIFMIRNPISQIVSLAKYFDATVYGKNAKRWRDSDIRTRMRYYIEDITCSPVRSHVYEVYKIYQGWLECAGLVVRFEDLVGERSQVGSYSMQKKTLKSIFDYLEIEIADSCIEAYAKKVFSTLSPTFNSGGNEDLSKYYDDELMDYYKKYVSEIALKYGYVQEGLDR